VETNCELSVEWAWLLNKKQKTERVVVVVCLYSIRCASRTRTDSLRRRLAACRVTAGERERKNDCNSLSEYANSTAFAHASSHNSYPRRPC
jgi:hypothetical protein